MEEEGGDFFCQRASDTLAKLLMKCGKTLYQGTVGTSAFAVPWVYEKYL